MTHDIPHEHPHRGEPQDTCGHYVAACKICGRAWCALCGQTWTPEQVQAGRWTPTPNEDEVVWDIPVGGTA